MNELVLSQENPLIPIKETENGDIVVSGRALHEFLEIKTPYTQWFERMTEYGFTENVDYILDSQKCETNNPKNPYTVKTDHLIKLDMAKELAMIQRNEKGKQARQYFLKIEKLWNSPEMVMRRALELANRQVKQLIEKTMNYEKQLEEQKPKVVFADAVSTAKNSILVGELAKLLKQNGIDIGQNRLFQWLRDNGYLIKRKGTDYNMPTQYAMELGLFEVKETTITHSDGHISITKTPKVTGKGQIYFINKFKSQ